MNTSINRRSCLLGLGTALFATACVSTGLEPGTDHSASAKAEPAHEHHHAVPMADVYTCPMHSQVVKDAPGKCPICGMNLVKKEGPSPQGAAGG